MLRVFDTCKGMSLRIRPVNDFRDFGAFYGRLVQIRKYAHINQEVEDEDSPMETRERAR